MATKYKARRGARILVVDDEEPVRKVARRFLEAEGYRVSEASNGLEAMSRLRRATQPDLLLVDLQMPEINGDELVRRVRSGRSGLKVLYVTGHVDKLMAERLQLNEWEAFLEKPFTAIGLLEAVSLLLNGTLAQEKQS
jgi:CheY-like chemotaxis protein